ncbi:MAG: TVP38/TMEM64 family protein [Candidatus Kerfeldbacteria bacterium]|nr:TVP38/TMEM64 family protein [Candidatus Kerfeldbacteria bacterium]
MSIRGTIRWILRREANDWKKDFFIIGGIILIVGAFIWWSPPLPDAATIQEWTERLGASGPLAMMMTIVAESILAPIPGTFISIAAGVLYGVWPGVLYVWVANVIGSSLTFFIGRKLGRPVVEKIVRGKHIDSYDAFFRRNRLLIALAYVIPILFPTDMIGYVVGLSQVSYRRFAIYMPIGFAINLTILTSFGNNLVEASKATQTWYFASMLILVFIAVLVQRSINRRSPV